MVTAAMKQSVARTRANLDPSRKDRTKLKSRLERELTNSKTAKEMKCRGHGTFVISRSVIYRIGRRAAQGTAEDEQLQEDLPKGKSASVKALTRQIIVLESP
ncbi:hypothetical protein Tco_0566391 [Tanacetum coccineum]